MHNDGLYLSHGPDEHALVVIREDDGATLWIRDFVTAGAAIDILQEDILSLHRPSAIRESLVNNKGFFIKEVVEPEDGYAACSFSRYLLSPSR
jgi:hypothetical protein